MSAFFSEEPLASSTPMLITNAHTYAMVSFRHAHSNLGCG